MVCNSGTGTPIADLRMAELSTAVARAPGVHPFGNDHHDTVRQAA
jgi:hypothetical protein